MRDFSLQKFEAICTALVDSGYQSVSIGDYLQNHRPKPFVIMRHDVDSLISHARKTARIEQQHGIRATYFFRTVNHAFDPETIKAVHEMGHEIGYHYEAVTQARGNIPKAIQIFERDLAKLRQFAPVQVASMHGSVLFPIDGRVIWQHTQPEQFDLLGEAYRDIDYTQVIYLSDTGRTWDAERYNVRDKTGIKHSFQVNTTDELIQLIQTRDIPQLCLLTHPERWQDGIWRWLFQQSRDVMVNLIKVAVKQIYRLKK